MVRGEAGDGMLCKLGGRPSAGGRTAGMAAAEPAAQTHPFHSGRGSCGVSPAGICPGDSSGPYLTVHRNVEADAIELQQTSVESIQRVSEIGGGSGEEAGRFEEERIKG